MMSDFLRQKLETDIKHELKRKEWEQIKAAAEELGLEPEENAVHYEALVKLSMW